MTTSTVNCNSKININNLLNEKKPKFFKVFEKNEIFNLPTKAKMKKAQIFMSATVSASLPQDQWQL